MKRLLFIASLVFVVCCRLGADDSVAPLKKQSEPTAYQDVVFFAETQPVLLRLHIRVDGRPLSAVWDDFVTRVFKHLDTNSDGFLDKGEAQRMPPAAVLFGGANGPNGAPAPAFRELDADGDGKVTRAELAAYFRRSGFGPFQGSNGQNSRNNYAFTVDGLLIESGDIVLDSSMSTGGNTDAVNDALFKLLDTNGDGKLSKEELLAAPVVLRKRDRNDDEVITPDEIVPGSGKPFDGSQVFVFALDGRVNTSFAPTNFWLVSSGESSLALARALQQRYWPKDDKSGVNGLKREHLGLDAATFAKLDVDGNGRLDLEELARFGRRTPDLELRLDLGQKPAVELVKRGTPVEAHVRAGRDGALILELGRTRVDLKGLATSKGEIKVAKQLREQYIAEFKATDRDNNGYLDMTEAMRSQFFRNTFKIMDRDGDGKLFEKEMLAFLDDFLELQAAAYASCASVGLTTEGKGLFELLDTDGDGRLSVRELRNAVKLLAELDRDGDGAISRNEIPRCSQATFRMGPAPVMASNPYQTIAFSADGAYLAAARSSAPTKPPRGPEWFRKMDRNGDGDVSRKEFLGTDAQFREIDTDGDGLISVEEAEAYDKKMRERREKK